MRASSTSTFWNQVATWGRSVAVGVAFFIVNVVVTARKKERAPLDPWDARTLEWITASPPKEHNFDVIPTVHAGRVLPPQYEEVSTRMAT